MVEGVHGQAKQEHGLRRAARRGLANVTIQVYLTAAVINLKRLATLLWLFLHTIWGSKQPRTVSNWPVLIRSKKYWKYYRDYGVIHKAA